MPCSSMTFGTSRPLEVFTFFFFNDTATTEIYTLSLHDALPICAVGGQDKFVDAPATTGNRAHGISVLCGGDRHAVPVDGRFLTGGLFFGQGAPPVARRRFDERGRDHVLLGPQHVLRGRAELDGGG